MVVIHKFEACRRCPGTTVWRVVNGRLLCERCKRSKDFARRPLWSRWLLDRGLAVRNGRAQDWNRARGVREGVNTRRRCLHGRCRGYRRGSKVSTSDSGA